MNEPGQGHRLGFFMRIGIARGLVQKFPGVNYRILLSSEDVVTIRHDGKKGGY
jgi:ribosomal protein S12